MRPIRLILLLWLCGCGSQPSPFTDDAVLESVSPDGSVTATVTEQSSELGDLTQVLLWFHSERCGGGAASSPEVGLELDLEWASDSLLVVLHRPDIRLEFGASGAVNQCWSRRVRVELRSVEGN